MHRRLMPLALAVGCAGETGFGGDCPADGLVVNEIFAANESVPFPDPSGAVDLGCGRPDWLELYNGAPVRVDLSGYSVTVTVAVGEPLDGRVDRPIWLERGAFAIVLAPPYEVPDSECDPNSPEARALFPREGPSWLFMHPDMDRDNGRLVLRAPGGGTCDDLFVPDQHTDLSWSRFGDGEDACAMAQPTPGAPNADPIDDARYPCSY